MQSQGQSCLSVCLPNPLPPPTTWQLDRCLRSIAYKVNNSLPLSCPSPAPLPVPSPSPPPLQNANHVEVAMEWLFANPELAEAADAPAGGSAGAAAGGEAGGATQQQQEDEQLAQVGARG